VPLPVPQQLNIGNPTKFFVRGSSSLGEQR
jgi:hypothetical protein